jgi:MFS transporter, DHA2 family, multidrug resistance protein
MLQGVALACIFIPLSTVALSTIDRKRMSEATGLNNLVRQLGGSFGVAIFASLLGRYTNQARNALIAHVTSGDPNVYGQLRMMARGLGAGVDAQTAGARALRALDGMVGGQAAMLGFDKAFFLGGLMFIVSMPLVFLLSDGRHSAQSGSTEHAVVEV